jgi:hypothetical protein
METQGLSQEAVGDDEPAVYFRARAASMIPSAEAACSQSDTVLRANIEHLA